MISLLLQLKRLLHQLEHTNAGDVVRTAVPQHSGALFLQLCALCSYNSAYSVHTTLRTLFLQLCALFSYNSAYSVPTALRALFIQLCVLCSYSSARSVHTTLRTQRTLFIQLCSLCSYNSAYSVPTAPRTPHQPVQPTTITVWQLNNTNINLHNTMNTMPLDA